MSQSDNGKGDAYRKVDPKKYAENCERLFGPSKLNLWPRDENGNLIGGNKNAEDEQK